jgi:hypothetical protein
MSTYDYSFMGTPELNKLSATPLVFDNTKCTGIVKLAQRVITLFLKNEESAFTNGVGTNILMLARTGNVLENGELNNLLTLAANKTRVAIQNSATAATPTDEQLQSLKASFQTDPTNRSGLIVTLRVESVSGITISMANNINLTG